MTEKLTRRQALGTAGAAFLAAGGLGSLEPFVAAVPAVAGTEAKAGSVAVTPSMTEGPYWIDDMLRRFDVRGNTSTASSNAGAVQAGVPLTLTINVLDAANGGAINGAHVDVWHANAYGLYSDEPGQPGGSTSGQNFLRGYQVTGVDPGAGTVPVNGRVTFRTIWPGWYSGRAIHIHVRVRTYDGSASVTNYTTQIFFSDADNMRVLAGAAPYNARSPQSDPTTDETDNVLTSAADGTNIVPVTGSVADGFAATFTIGLSGVASNAKAVSTDASVSASLKSASVVTAANGSRTVLVNVHAGESLTAHASVVREGHVLGTATGHLTPGWHSLRVAVPAGVEAGAATAKVVLSDAAGNTRTLAAGLRIPR
jgi:protocatechuate 3,4-dioxygenase beta subunit